MESTLPCRFPPTFSRILLFAGLAACSADAPDKSSAEDGQTPSCATALLWVDADLDGYGDAQFPEEACLNTPGHAEVAGDCDDTNADVNPGVREVCNDIDDDCDGTIDRGMRIDVWTDADGDGFGDPTTADSVCTAGPQHVRDNTDCDDNRDDVFPGATEVCDGVDQDCDDAIDEDAVDRITVFDDLDRDGLGAPGTDHLACPDTSATATNDWDCDDADETTPLVVDNDGFPDGTGTLDDPFDTIQGAVDAALLLSGEACVIVRPGLYLEAIDLTAADVHLASTDGATQTVIDALDLGLPVLQLGAANQANTLVEGFTITDGTPFRYTYQVHPLGNTIEFRTDMGAGIYAVSSSATLRDLLIADNAIIDPEESSYVDSAGDTIPVNWSGYGGGLYSERGELVIERCTFAGNEAEQGGAIYVDDAIRVYQTQFLGNIATEFGGAIGGKSADILVENAIFAGNLAPNAPAISITNSLADLSHITIHEDVAAMPDSALVSVSDVRGTWRNWIVSAPADVGIRVLASTSSVSLTSVLFNGPVAATERASVGAFAVTDSQTGDPLFIGITEDLNPTNDDLHLDPTSPAVDAGSVGTDPDGSPADLGAYGGALGSW